MIQNPLIRVRATLVSREHGTKEVAKLYARLFDNDWADFEEILNEAYFHSTGKIADDEPVCDPFKDPQTGYDCVDRRSCLLDFGQWAQLNDLVVECGIAGDYSDFFEVFVNNSATFADGKDPQDFAILLTWCVLHDGTAVDRKDLLGE